MNKVKNKFLKVLLSVGLAISFCFMAQARKEVDLSKDRNAIFHFDYIYKNKDMEDQLNGKFIEDTTKYDQFGFKQQNKTSAKDAVHFYVVMKKLFAKYKISGDSLKEMFRMFNPLRKEVKLSGSILTKVQDSEFEKFKKLVTNLEKDLKNIKITEQDVTNAKKDLKKITENEIKSFNDEYIEKYEKLDLSKDKTLIKIAKDILKRSLKNYKRAYKTAYIELPKNLTKEMVKDVSPETIAKHSKEKIKNILKNKKELKKIGKEEVERIKRYEKVQIPNLKAHIKQFDEVKFEDVKDLTKDLKLFKKPKK